VDHRRFGRGIGLEYRTPSQRRVPYACIGKRLVGGLPRGRLGRARRRQHQACACQSKRRAEPRIDSFRHDCSLRCMPVIVSAIRRVCSGRVRSPSICRCKCIGRSISKALSKMTTPPREMRIIAQAASATSGEGSEYEAALRRDVGTSRPHHPVYAPCHRDAGPDVIHIR